MLIEKINKPIDWYVIMTSSFGTFFIHIFDSYRIEMCENMKFVGRFNNRKLFSRKSKRMCLNSNS